MANSRKPRHLLLKTALLALAVLLSYLALLYGAVASGKNDNYFAANTDKLKALSRAGHPKLVLVGGSNLAFGIDTPRLREALQLPVVNMGVSVDFGLKLMLDQIAPHLGPGDVVVLVPEYENFCGDSFYGTGIGLFELTALRQNHTPLSLMQKLALARAALKETPRVFSYKPAKPQAEASPAADLFSRSSFNRDGDVTAHLDLPPRKIPEYPLDKDLNRDAARYVRDFAATNASRGVTTMLFFPPLQQSYYQRNTAFLEQIAAMLKETGVPVASAPRDFVYQDGMFFDCVYHLNAAGRAQRTEKMIRMLRESLPPMLTRLQAHSS